MVALTPDTQLWIKDTVRLRSIAASRELEIARTAKRSETRDISRLHQAAEKP